MFPNETRIVLDPDHFGPDGAALEERLNELNADCGCETGAFAVLVAFVSMVAWTAWVRPELTWSLGGTAVGLLLAAAIAGKVAGLVHSRLLLWRLLARLESNR